jgi:hypothetical protein
MTYRMADAIFAANLPPGMDAYGGYDNGNWPDFVAVAAAHPGAHLLDLTVWLANRGTGIDVEPGDATVAQAPVYVRERLVAGVILPVVYCPASWSQAVLNVMAAAGVPRSLWRLLSAHYGAGQHICGPGTCGYPQADGTQWIDHGTWDESLLSDGFFGTPAPPKPIIQPAASIQSSTLVPEENMRILQMTNVATDGQGDAWKDFDLAGSRVCGRPWAELAAPGAEPGGGYDKGDANCCNGGSTGRQRVQLTGAIPNVTPGYTLYLPVTP